MTDVRIPDANRIGDVGEGWRVSLTTLMNERTAIGGRRRRRQPRRGGAANDAVAVWNATSTSRAHRRPQGRADAAVGARPRSAASPTCAPRQAAKAGNPGPEMSIAKLEFSELNKGLYDFCIDLLGVDGQIGYDYTFRRPDELDATGADKGLRYAFLRVRANSIEGGTSEIMRNILGEQVLGLPGEPRVDKEPPWSQVPRS